jgi:hypothetical protein
MVLLTTPPRGDGPAWPFFLFSLILMVVVLLPTYVLNALPLYSIANRRQLKHAWLAWVPIGSVYVLGLISDDYQLLALNNEKNRRIWLPLFQGLTVAMFVTMWVLVIAEILREEPTNTAIVILVILGTVAATIVGAVIKWIATYDLFRSCEPDRAGVYLAICLGIRFVMPSFSIVREILMLVVSGKDLGMPRLDLLENREPAERPNRVVKEPWDI